MPRLLRYIYRVLFDAANKVDLGKLGATGHGVVIHPGTVGDPENIRIGNYVYIGPGCYIWGRGGIDIGNNVIIGPQVTIHTVNHNYDNATLLPYDDVSYLEPVVICQNVWVGGHAMIVPGVTIGEGAVIAMGAVVTKNVPPLAVVGGNPAKVIKYRDEEQYQHLRQSGAFYLKAKIEGRTKPKLISKDLGSKDA